MNYTIRRAKSKDLGAVWVLCGMPALRNPDGARPRTWWLKALANSKRALMFVAVCNKKVIGFVTGEELVGKVGYVHMVAVDADCRGNGVGSALLDRMEAALVLRGCHCVLLYACRDVLGMMKRRGFVSGNKYTECLKFIGHAGR